MSLDDRSHRTLCALEQLESRIMLAARTGADLAAARLHAVRATAPPAHVRSAPAGLLHTTARLGEPRVGASVRTVGDVAFISGGNTADFDTFVDIYDASARRWSRTSPPAGLDSELSQQGAAAQVGDKLVFRASAGLDIYDADSGQWSSSTPAPREVYEGNPTVVGSKVIFAGGFGDLLTDPDSDDVAIYDTSTS